MPPEGTYLAARHAQIRGRILNTELAEYHIATHADVPDIDAVLI
jgi:CO/xanthine dehydrogenase Mo-binding subunit